MPVSQLTRSPLGSARVSRRLWDRGDPEARGVGYWAPQRRGNVINEGVPSLKSFERFVCLAQAARIPCGAWGIPYRNSCTRRLVPLTRDCTNYTHVTASL